MAIVIHDFATADPILALKRTAQVEYLHDYLLDLGAVSAVEEQRYFDRDYLSEYSAFYATASRGYPNYCRRVHYFTGTPLTRDRLQLALDGDAATQGELQSNYLGFVVVRPIPAAPLGRTVLKWYPDPTPATPRVTKPARDYRVHLCGLKLTVHGLAWQQQDSAVGACATVALWTLLHASAFDEHHAIPTTADLTRFSHRKASWGTRVFPSNGLRIEQMLEAIKEAGLAPIVVEGNQLPSGATRPVFSRERFSATCASMIRAGYPVIINGMLENGGLHAVCAVGFRDVGATMAGAGQLRFQDEGIRHVYVNNDNTGPNVRFRIDIDATTQATVLVRDPPPPVVAGATPSRNRPYPTITPYALIVAVPETLRTSPLELNSAAVMRALPMVLAVTPHLKEFGLTIGARFVRQAEYLNEVLPNTLGTPTGAPILGRVRLAICENVPAMSLDLGLVRFSWGALPLMDLLFDTSDSDRHLSPTCHVVYQAPFAAAVQAIQQHFGLPFGVQVDAF